MCSNLTFLQGKTTLYSAMFGSADVDNSRATSMFINESSIEQIQPVLPDNVELMKLCSVAQLLYPDSLHHQTWLALRLHRNTVPDCKLCFYSFYIILF